jgi:glycosyltransferase involved in cell wall biosynthesis
MNKKPFFSVIVPTYSRLPMLKQTLEHLNRQTYARDRYEIIVVDDGSTDGTEPYLQELKKQKALHYIRQSNSGPAQARNAGADLAKGEVLAFTDDDCLPDANWLTALAGAYADHQKGKIGGIGGRIENIANDRFLQRYYQVQGGYHTGHEARPHLYLDTANASFPRSIFMEMGGFNERFVSGEDVEFGLRLLSAEYTLDVTLNAIIRHVGRSSLKGMFQQSLLRGYGMAYLSFSYSSLFEPPTSQGVRLAIRNYLDYLVAYARRAPLAIRPFVYGASGAFHKAAYSLPITEHFLRKQLPEQRERYRQMGLSQKQSFVYLGLETVNFIFVLLGRVVGGYAYGKQQVRLKKETR